MGPHLSYLHITVYLSQQNGDAVMRERDPHFAKAIDEIEKGIEESLKRMMEKKAQPKETVSANNKKTA
jgi:ribosome-associated translation inhibitor RaiA